MRKKKEWEGDQIVYAHLLDVRNSEGGVALELAGRASAAREATSRLW
jgi:hypothetical protein